MNRKKLCKLQLLM